MLSILIADDEEDIIDLCRALIDHPAVQVIGQAHNGVELLEQIGQLHPDAVITDICMPGMTGLELIEKASRLYPEVRFIVMSGYTDFQYAQTALRFGVWDYLLKPLKKTELNRALDKLNRSLCEQQNREATTATVRGELEESLEILRQRYLRDAWEGGHAQPQDASVGIRLFRAENSVLQCIAFSTDSVFPATAEDAPALGKQAGDTLEKIGEIARQECQTTELFLDWPMAVCLLLFDASNAASQSAALIKQIGGKIRGFNSTNEFVRLSGAASALQPDGLKALREACRQSRTALKWRLEKIQNDVISYDAEVESQLQQMTSFATSRWREKMLIAVECLDAIAVRDVACGAWKAILEGGKSVGGQYHLLEEMLTCLNEAFAQLPWGDSTDAPPPIEVYDILSGGYGSDTILQRLITIATRRIAACKEHAQHRENSVVRQAKAYVEKHYAENISLSQVAKEVCLSAAYFSTVFKVETGSGFVEFLQHVRINKAKKLLRETKMRIADVAQAVGYRDMKFFNKIFAKETTVTPSEYRKFYG